MLMYHVNDQKKNINTLPVSKNQILIFVHTCHHLAFQHQALTSYPFLRVRAI